MGGSIIAPHMPDNANIILNVYDGKRQLLDKAVRWSAQAIDGRGLNERKTLLFPDLRGGSQLLNVPFFDNFGDNYTIIVTADGFQTGAWRPVTVSGSGPVTADILLLPNNGTPHFAGATWDQLSQLRPNVAKMIRACCPDPAAAAAMYASAYENRPPCPSPASSIWSPPWPTCNCLPGRTRWITTGMWVGPRETPLPRTGSSSSTA